MVRPPQSANALRRTSNRRIRLASYAAIVASLTAWAAAGSLLTTLLAPLATLGAVRAFLLLRTARPADAFAPTSIVLLASAVSVADGLVSGAVALLVADLVNVSAAGLLWRWADRARVAARAAWAAEKREAGERNATYQRQEHAVIERAEQQRRVAEADLTIIEALDVLTSAESRARAGLAAAERAHAAQLARGTEAEG